jgi:diguanylate cyclase (GGDEF)-like protein
MSNDRKTPLDDRAKQAIRIRRFWLGTISYFFMVSLGAIFWWLDYIDKTVMLNFAGAIILQNIVFYIAIKSNFNLRFADPSMGLAQICLSILPGLYVMYHAQQSRGVFLLLCVSAAMYGLFQFRFRDFVIMTCVVVGGYSTLIGLLYLYHPLSTNFKIEFLQLFVICAAFIQFSWVGGYIAKLRDKVKIKNEELETQNTELKKALLRIEQLAIRDELTGVFNRRYLMESIKNEKVRSERSGAAFSICILDIDHFKKVNDTYGHLAGDEILKTVAKTASLALRQSDYFGRYGGEEFVMVLTGSVLEYALSTAKRVRMQIEALRFDTIDPDLRITVSIGIAVSNSDEETSHTFKRADKALYRAKEEGRNRCMFDDTPHESIDTEKDMTS